MTILYGVPLIPLPDPLIPVLYDIANNPFGTDVVPSDDLPPGFAIKSRGTWTVSRRDFDRLSASAPAAAP